MKLNYLSVMAALMLSSCGGQPPRIGGASDIHVVQGELPAPTDADLYGPKRPYLIAPFDTLVIDVFGVQDLHERAIKVDGEGKLSYPLVGSLDVSGKTANEIALMIEQRLRGKYIRDPQVTVNLQESSGRNVTVYGQVREPGLFPVNGETTLLDAIALAKGLSDYANDSDVVVFRTVNGQQFATLYNLKAIGRGAYSDPSIYPNDRVVVGDSNARRVFDKIVQAATLITTPITILLTRKF